MADRVLRIAAFAAIIGALGLAPAYPQPPTPSPLSLADVIDRLGTYLNSYSDQMSRAVATERYKQGSRSGTYYAEAILDSEFGIIKVPNYAGWLGFRDVLRVNGKVVQDHESRLQDLLLNPSPAALEQASRIAEESARHNIG